MKIMLSLVLSVLAIVFFAQPSHALTGAGGKPFVAEYVYSYADLGGATGFQALPGNDLPQNAVVESGFYIVEEALTSSGSATVAIGDAASGTRYKGATNYNSADYTVDAPLAVASGVPVLIDSANEGNFGITIGTAVLTGGKLRVVLKGQVLKGN